MLALLSASTAAAALPAIGRAQGSPTKGQDVLIVYLTRTRNTEALARLVQARTGGTLVALQPQQPYPQNYQAHVDQVVRENEQSLTPALRNPVDPAPYSTVFVGFPTWGMQLPPPVKSWLAQVKLSGKRVLPFNTHAGFGVGSGSETVRALCPNSTVLAGLSIEGGYEKRGQMLMLQGDRARRADEQVAQWLARHQIS